MDVTFYFEQSVGLAVHCRYVAGCHGHSHHLLQVVERNVLSALLNKTFPSCSVTKISDQLRSWRNSFADLERPIGPGIINL